MEDTDTLPKPITESIRLAESLGYWVRELSERWTTTLRRKTETHSVTEGQWRYLRELWEEDGLSQRELSDRVGRDGSTTVTALRSLERSGYAEATKDAHDRRKARVCLTQRGRELEAELMPLIEECERIAIQDLSATEIAHFKKVLIHMLENFGGQERRRMQMPSLGAHDGSTKEG